MGDALFELEQVLASRSKREELTPQEAHILQTCKSRALREFTASFLVGGAIAWAATSKFSKIFRINLAAGAAAFLGLWRIDRSLYKCADHVLAMDGTRLQKELADLIVTKYQNDPSKMELISKHFYSEKVFDDSTSDHPKLRWRYRSFFGDHVAHGQKTRDHDSNDDSQGNSYTDSYASVHNDSKRDSDVKITNYQTKQAFRNPGLDMMGEPDAFDCIFGYSAPVEEIHHPSTPNKSPGVHNRSHRRSHRRRRMRRHEDHSNYEHATAG